MSVVIDDLDQFLWDWHSLYLDTFKHRHGQGEPCTACLEGAICYGEHSPPIAKPGYYSYAEANYSFFQVSECPANEC